MLRSGWSGSLDDLARALATPMPRRRALGVFGVTLVGLATGGTASGAGRPLGKQQSSECGNGYKVCSPETKACRATCCPVHTDCSFGPKAASNGCPISDGCCDPCNPLKSKPDGQGGCKPGPVADDCCKDPCGKSKKCCQPDEVCAKWTFHGSKNVHENCREKCGPGARRCRLAPECCPNGQDCCSSVSDEASFCCGPEQVCVRALGGNGEPGRLCVRKCRPPQVRCNFICCDEDKRAYQKLKNGRVRCHCLRD